MSRGLSRLEMVVSKCQSGLTFFCIFVFAVKIIIRDQQQVLRVCLAEFFFFPLLIALSRCGLPVTAQLIVEMTLGLGAAEGYGLD